MASFWYRYCELWSYFTPCSSVSIINFEHVIAGWAYFRFLLLPAWIKATAKGCVEIRLCREGLTTWNLLLIYVGHSVFFCFYACVSLCEKLFAESSKKFLQPIFFLETQQLVEISQNFTLCLLFPIKPILKVMLFYIRWNKVKTAKMCCMLNINVVWRCVLQVRMVTQNGIQGNQIKIKKFQFDLKTRNSSGNFREVSWNSWFFVSRILCNCFLSFQIVEKFLLCKLCHPRGQYLGLP